VFFFANKSTQFELYPQSAVNWVWWHTNVSIFYLLFSTLAVRGLVQQRDVPGSLIYSTSQW